MNKAIRYEKILDQEIESYRQHKRNWRVELSPSIDWQYSWRRQDLHNIVDSARLEFETATDKKLPENLAVHGPWVSMPYRWQTDHRSEMVGAAVKMAGWLRAAAEIPALVHLLSRTIDGNRGYNSPYQHLSLWDLAERYSPGAVARRLWSIRRRADEILSPTGLHTSWAALGNVLSFGPRATGKAAVCAAAYTLGSYSVKYRAARDHLASVMGSQHDVTDGVHAIVRRNEAITEAHGIKVTPLAWRTNSACGARKVGYLVRFGERTYHYSDYGHRPDPKEAIRAALSAWQQQKKLALDLDLPDSNKVSVLVTREDSLAGGNCVPGTDSFIYRNGYQHRWMVPAEWLINSGNSDALNAVSVAISRYREFMATISPDHKTDEPTHGVTHRFCSI